MKANELMIGDFVRKLESGGHTIPVKIVGIYDNNVDYETRNGQRGSISLEGLEPISLKKVHVTKNGFKVKDADDEEFVYKDGFEIKVYFSGGMFEGDIDPVKSLSISFAEKELWMEIDNFHELQNAMKLFGIDKEIEL